MIVSHFKMLTGGAVGNDDLKFLNSKASQLVVN